MSAHGQGSFRFAMCARYLQLAAEYRAQGWADLAHRCIKNAHRALDAEVRAHFDEGYSPERGSELAEPAYDFLDEVES